ncbi:hypothetical protein [Jiangella asiatica]|uniref:Uncharacterized protein n=1 Tax=Jiangella asiatica TaxID=2530372 RepID=A0A4R5D3P3_9ACTN|nr:hypothetical protein [Jiangella asiatica]TDE07989.1 hypothetical protein E1269_18795 [Jiangella asiatica]
METAFHDELIAANPRHTMGRVTLIFLLGQPATSWSRVSVLRRVMRDSRPPADARQWSRLTGDPGPSRSARRTHIGVDVLVEALG